MQEKCSSVTGGEYKHVCYYSLCQCEKREGCAGCNSLPVISAQAPQPPLLDSSSDTRLLLPPGAPTPDPFLLSLHFPTIAAQSYFREGQICIIGLGMASDPKPHLVALLSHLKGMDVPDQWPTPLTLAPAPGAAVAPWSR